MRHDVEVVRRMDGERIVTHYEDMTSGEVHHLHYAEQCLPGEFEMTVTDRVPLRDQLGEAVDAVPRSTL